MSEKTRVIMLRLEISDGDRIFLQSTVLSENMISDTDLDVLIASLGQELLKPAIVEWIRFFGIGKDI